MEQVNKELMSINISLSETWNPPRQVLLTEISDAGNSTIGFFGMVSIVRNLMRIWYTIA